MSPYGTSGLLKEARPSQLVAAADLTSPESRKEVENSGWVELEAGELVKRDGQASLPATMCKSRMVVVEVDGRAQLYPAHRVVRMVAFPPALSPHWDDLWDDLGHGCNAGVERSRGRWVPGSVHLAHMSAMLKAEARGIGYRSRHLPPLSKYWVLAGIPQECIRQLVQPKKNDSAVAAAPGGPAGVCVPSCVPACVLVCVGVCARVCVCMCITSPRVASKRVAPDVPQRMSRKQIVTAHLHPAPISHGCT